ncbi:MAG: hypothetical protein ACYDCC_16135 [Actinomycetota bacterium]
MIRALFRKPKVCAFLTYFGLIVGCCGLLFVHILGGRPTLHHIDLGLSVMGLASVGLVFFGGAILMGGRVKRARKKERENKRSVRFRFWFSWKGLTVVILVGGSTAALVANDYATDAELPGYQRACETWLHGAKDYAQARSEYFNQPGGSFWLHDSLADAVKYDWYPTDGSVDVLIESNDSVPHGPYYAPVIGWRRIEKPAHCSIRNGVATATRWSFDDSG